MSDYQWRNNLACVATYNVLEGETFLDEFEDVNHPFDKAAGLKMGQLRYFPHTTANPDILMLLGFEMARRFLSFVVKTYSVKKQLPTTTTADLLQGLADLFGRADTTLVELAALLDSKVKFVDEV